jgi:iron complex transport system substrate-binding protein
LEQEQSVLDSHSSALRTAVVHMPDFYGPYADLGYADVFIREALAGKTASWLGSLDAWREFPRMPTDRSGLLKLAAVLAAATLASCAGPASSRAGGSADGGAKHRIVTLMPSFVDDLYAIGAGRRVVAVSAFTDAPQAKNLPRVADSTSVDAERIVALQPDLVVGIPAQERLVEPLRRAGLDVVLLPDDTLEQIFSNLESLGKLTGRRSEAAETIARLRHETALLHARTRGFKSHPSVFVVLSSAPIWTAGATSYISQLIELAGGVNAAGDVQAAYGQYSAEALLRSQPDALISDRGIHLDAVLDREPWRALRAVQLGHVFLADPDLLERPGPEYNQGLRWLIDRLTPLAN